MHIHLFLEDGKQGLNRVLVSGILVNGMNVIFLLIYNRSL